LILTLDRDKHPRLLRMEIEVPWPKAVASARRDMLAGSMTAPRLARAASVMSVSKSVSSGPMLAYKTVLGMVA
jgi:hypothetical protein